MFVNTALVIGASILIAIIRNGKLRQLFNVEIRYMWIVLVAFVVQFGAIFFFPKLVHIADPITYAAILVFAFLNRKQVSLLIVLAGVIMNYTVMLANGGRMPVYVPDAKLIAPEAIPSLVAGTYGKQIAMSAHTHLNLLGDLFYLGSPWPNPTLLSAGDLLIFTGVFLFIQWAMVRKQPSGDPQGEDYGREEIA